MATTSAPEDRILQSKLIARLSFLDRFLPLWIFLAMAVGLLAGDAFPGLATTLNQIQLGHVSIPIGVGLLWMMYPVLARVRDEELGRLRGAWKIFGHSLLMNWLLGPIVMFA